MTLSSTPRACIRVGVATGFCAAPRGRRSVTLAQCSARELFGWGFNEGPAGTGLALEYAELRLLKANWGGTAVNNPRRAVSLLRTAADKPVTGRGIDSAGDRLSETPDR